MNGRYLVGDRSTICCCRAYLQGKPVAADEDKISDCALKGGQKARGAPSAFQPQRFFKVAPAVSVPCS